MAETIRRVCNLPIDDLSSIQSLSKQQVIEIVELVEHELLSQSSIDPVKRSVMSDPSAIREKQENQLIEGLNKVVNDVLKKCPQVGSAIEDAVMMYFKDDLSGQDVDRHSYCFLGFVFLTKVVFSYTRFIAMLVLSC